MPPPENGRPDKAVEQAAGGQGAPAAGAEGGGPAAARGDRAVPFWQRAAEQLGVSADAMRRFAAEYSDLQVLYRSAIREVNTRLEILDDEFQFRHKRNPIHHIQTRLKTPQSMMEKLGRRNLEPTIEVLRDQLTDIAGVRVICSYVDDIYLLADLLCAQDGVKLVRTHDYIKRPKPNGYRSLHIVVEVPVNFSDGKQQVPVEIQIRTIAMDFWASLEHELRYKSANKITRDIARELRDCADNISELDERMQIIYRKLEQLERGGTAKKNDAAQNGARGMGEWESAKWT